MNKLDTTAKEVERKKAEEEAKKAAAAASRSSGGKKGKGDKGKGIESAAPYIAHYHTGGVPGRHEIDETQGVQYPAIMRAIVATGYTGWVAQEFIPKHTDKIASLKQAVEICTV